MLMGPFLQETNQGWPELQQCHSPLLGIGLGMTCGHTLSGKKSPWCLQCHWGVGRGGHRDGREGSTPIRQKAVLLVGLSQKKSKCYADVPECPDTENSKSQSVLASHRVTL